MLKTKSLSQDAIWIVVDRSVKAAGGFLVSALVARHLGPSNYGLMSSLLAVFALVIPIAQLGFGNTITKTLAEYKGDKDSLATALAFAIGASGILTIPAMVGASTILVDTPASRGVLLAFAASLGAPFQWVIVYRGLMEARGRISTASRLETINFLLFASVRLLLVQLNADVELFLIANGAEAAALAHLYARHSRFPWPPCRKRVKYVLTEIAPKNWPQLATALLVIVQSRLDIIIVGSLISQEALGQYSAALKIPEATGVVATIIYSLFNARILTAHTTRQKNELTLTCYRAHMATGLVTCAMVFCLGPKLISLAFGSNFSDASTLIQIMALRPIFTHIGMAREGYLIRSGFLKHSLYSLVLGAPLFFLISILLQRNYGVHGVVTASYISYAATFIALDIWNPATRGNLRQIFFPFGRARHNS